MSEVDELDVINKYKRLAFEAENKLTRIGRLIEEFGHSAKTVDELRLLGAIYTILNSRGVPVIEVIKDQHFKDLQVENERLKAGLKHYKRAMHNIISVAQECTNSNKWNYKEQKNK